LLIGGGILTGVSTQNAEEFPTKWIELLRELLPHLSSVALAVNPDNPLSPGMINQVRRAASATQLKVVVLEARGEEDFPLAIAKARQRARAVIVQPDSIAIHDRQLKAAELERHRLPALYGQRDFVEAGGLMSYGPDLAALWRRAADYVDRLLEGANPAELPIEQPRRLTS
jgi:putative tryptophan/tyrosine transport system substrate-binding protein